MVATFQRMRVTMTNPLNHDRQFLTEFGRRVLNHSRVLAQHFREAGDRPIDELEDSEFGQFSKDGKRALGSIIEAMRHDPLFAERVEELLGSGKCEKLRKFAGRPLPRKPPM